ncbi:ABC transporter permease [Natronoglycomyces albus]|uniref:ABC transporter permease n=1 Tax=Natronoglycomyces albus TaxID=2811108 RepID=A0A895XNV2_9ACTN|nr:ABC transporter permease [Natronoglycomyces albus]QSB04176.1 ABC transporter permease [Natronoglycomyces albus]
MGRRRGASFASDIVIDAWRAVLGRRLRSVLTICGVALGIGAGIATIGIASSAADAVSEHFDAVAATSVTVRFPDGVAPPGPTRIDEARKLNGAEEVGAMCATDEQVSVTRTRPGHTDRAERFQLAAAQPETLQALGATLETGRWPDTAHVDRNDAVALIDSAAARRLGILDLVEAPVIYIGGERYVVAGIFVPPRDQPRLTNAVVVPYSQCMQDPQKWSSKEVVARSKLGAASHVAAEIPWALHPEEPQRLSVAVPPDLSNVRQGVEGDTQALYLGLAGLSLFIATIGIANTTYVAVLERRGEIGLRRATGAGKGRIACQFLAESALLGASGGLVGVVVGVNVSAAVALYQGWMVVLSPLMIPVGLSIGVLVGMLAGLWPALAAARLDPVAALRSM